MIQLEEVSKIYEDSVRAVDKLSFTVREGEVFGLIGTSGCGKTTTLKMINRLVSPTSGSIYINNKDVQNQRPEMLRRDIGYVIQDVGLFPHYSIQENIAVVPRLLGWEDKRVNRRSDELLELVGLDPSQFAHRMPDALSGGQQQRVGFARALAADPAIILMDEPFGALDPITKEQVRGEFKSLLNQINKTIVLVTHDIAEAFDLCDRVALMDLGRLQQVGTPKELLLSPANKFVSSFFDVNRLELEMQTITLGDILPMVSTQNVSNESRGYLVNISDSIADVLNQCEVTDSSVEFLSIQDEDRNRILAQLKMEDLFQAFYKVRKRIGEEHHG